MLDNAISLASPRQPVFNRSEGCSGGRADGVTSKEPILASVSFIGASLSKAWRSPRCFTKAFEESR